MTEFEDRRSLFGAQTSIDKKARPLPPSKAQKPPHLNISTAAAPAPGKQSLGETSAEKVSKLNPALLKNLEQPSSRGGLSPVIMGGGRGARTKSLSPATKKKAKSTSKLLHKPSANGSGAPSEQTTKLGVGLLASVTRDMSASTGNLGPNSPSPSKSPSSTHTKGRPSPPSLHRKSTSPPKSRKAAALSMDVSRVNNTSLVPRAKSPRPVSTGSPHRLPGSPGLHSTPEHVPSGSSLLTRRRNDSFDDSFEDDSYSPPQTRHNHTPFPRIQSSALHVRSPAVSRSTENLLEDSGSSASTAKPRSNSDCLFSPVKKKKPKPAPPPKKPGLASKPAPPPKPSAALLKKPANVGRAPPSPRAPPPHEPRPKRTTPEVASPTHLPSPRGAVSTSPPLTSSPNSAPPRQGDFGGVNSPLPSTPSPRTSQLEAVQRNADSGFVSEATDDLASPVAETTVGSVEREEERGEGVRGDDVTEREKETEEPVEVWDEARVSQSA